MSLSKDELHTLEEQSLAKNKKNDALNNKMIKQRLVSIAKYHGLNVKG
jgi:hypothetical protein